VGSSGAELTGAEIFARALSDEGVEFIFGYPGGAVLHIYDALYTQDKVKHILARHEQGATHAADGYARSSGKPGVVIVTSGPGATNAVTGIATAYMDSIPLVVFTGQVPTHLIGNDAFQEADNIGITRPCVKHNFLVKDVNDLAVTIKKAFYVASGISLSRQDQHAFVQAGACWSCRSDKTRRQVAHGREAPDDLYRWRRHSR